jgi:hypothetical protein
MEPAPAPVRIKPPPEPFTEISPSWSQFLGLTADGTVYQWGTGRVRWNEEEWQPTVGAEDLAYKKIELPEKIIKIRAVGHSDYALGESGNLYIWGKDSLYYMGIENETAQYIPRVLLANVQDFAVTALGEDMLALTRSGEVCYRGAKGKVINGIFSMPRIQYPEKIVAVFPGNSAFYAAGQERLYKADSAWLEAGMVSDEFPRLLDYKYQGETDAGAANITNGVLGVLDATSGLTPIAI